MQGHVVSVTPKDVIVDFGYKLEGLVPLEQLKNADGTVTVQRGDAIDVMVDRSGPQPEGYVLLSFSKAAKLRIWDTLEEAMRDQLLVNARVLGMAPLAPMSAFRVLFPIMWAGFTVNAITGFILFAIAATVKALQVIFWIKLSLVAMALAVTVPILRMVKGAGEHGAVPARARVLAVLSLVTWTGAIIAGRLMAYIK